MRVVIAILFVLVADHPVWAQMSESAQSKFVTDLHDRLGLSDMVRRVGDGKIDDRKIRIIAAILRNTNEVEIHRMRGGRNNKVLLSPDGHSEAVYDGNQTLVKDGINDGSYNYFHPQKDALRHFTFDIAPWLLFGQSRDDPTTRAERLQAYSNDFYAGVTRALGESRTKLDEVSLKEPGCVEAIAVFLIAIEHAKAEEVFRAFNSKNKESDQNVAASVRKLEGGLRLLFASDRDKPTTAK